MEAPKNLPKIKRPYFNIVYAAKSYTPRTYQRARANEMLSFTIHEEADERRRMEEDARLSKLANNCSSNGICAVQRKTRKSKKSKKTKKSRKSIK